MKVCEDCYFVNVFKDYFKVMFSLVLNFREEKIDGFFFRFLLIDLIK